MRRTVTGMAQIAAVFREAAKKRVRWTLHLGGQTYRYEGRVPQVRRWRQPDEPHLLLRPGTMDGAHVLADMELRLRFHEGQFFLARRRWYEEEDLDLTRLGPGPLAMELETLPEE